MKTKTFLHIYNFFLNINKKNIHTPIKDKDKAFIPTNNKFIKLYICLIFSNQVNDRHPFYTCHSRYIVIGC